MHLYRYRGKRMRIDYFLVSEKLKDKIVKCEMHGQGIELEGMIYSLLLDRLLLPISQSLTCFSLHKRVNTRLLQLQTA